jgi:hypothetical protein
MAHTDLDRVQTDLAAMKAVCVEPAIPAEDIVPNLILAAFGVLLMAGIYWLPLVWVSRAVKVFGLLVVAVYIPWKRRILRSDYPRRWLEAKELRASVVGGAAILAYVLWFRFSVNDSRVAPTSMLGAIVCLLGITCVVYYLFQPNRRYYLGTGIAVLIGGLLIHLASEPASIYAIGSGILIAVGLSNAILLWWAARRQRSEQGGG